MEDWKTEVTKAYKTSRLLRITGYQSSDGGISDLTIRLPVEKDAYYTAVRESLEQLKKGDIKYPSHYAEVWADAVREQTESWRRTLNGEQAQRASKIEYNQHPDGYLTKAGAVNQVVLPHAFILKRTLRRLHKAALSAPKTLAKQYIREYTKVGQYRGSLILEPGKFESVECIAKE